MTTILTPEVANIIQGPRGIGARAAGGAYTQDCQQDLIDTDSLHVAPTQLTGTSDAINPHVSGNYIIATGSADAITLGVPTAGADDNLTINFWSDTLYAHTITCPSAVIAGGDQVVKAAITLKAFRGAGVCLRAWNGTWQVIWRSGITSIA